MKATFSVAFTFIAGLEGGLIERKGAKISLKTHT